nr:SNF2 N-domain-containing protein incomplete domain containing protein [Pandoravirus belohorizontensis]
MSSASADIIKVRLPRPADRRGTTTRKAPATRRPARINLVGDDSVNTRLCAETRPTPLKRADAVAALWIPEAVHAMCADRVDAHGRDHGDAVRDSHDEAPLLNGSDGGLCADDQKRDEHNSKYPDTGQEIGLGVSVQHVSAPSRDGAVANVKGNADESSDDDDEKETRTSKGHDRVADDHRRHGPESARGRLVYRGSDGCTASGGAPRGDASDLINGAGGIPSADDKGTGDVVHTDVDVDAVLGASVVGAVDSDGDNNNTDEGDSSGDEDSDDDSVDSRDRSTDDSDHKDPTSDGNDSGVDRDQHSEDARESEEEDDPDGAYTCDSDDDDDDDKSDEQYDGGEDGSGGDGNDEASDGTAAREQRRPQRRSRRVGAGADATVDDGIWRRARVPPSQRVPLDEHLVDEARRGTLTVEALDAVDPTVALRLATVDAARPTVERWWGHPVRGLPMVAGPDPAVPYALLPHQVHAMRWMRAREALSPGRIYGVAGGILSLRMGMGKTLTSLAHILSAPRGEMPTLVLCSARVLQEWHTSGVAKFFGAVDADGAPLVRALYFHRDYMTAAAMRAVDRRALGTHDIVLTTYDMCLAECRRGHYDEDCLERGPKGRVTAVHARARSRADNPGLVGGAVLYGTLWERIVCDESQRFANPTTSIYRAVMALYGRYKWCLTGTPIRNSHTDIWAQMRFLGYTGIASRAVWKRDGPTFYTRHRLSEAVLVMGYGDHNDAGHGSTGDHGGDDGGLDGRALAVPSAPRVDQTRPPRASDRRRPDGSLPGPTGTATRPPSGSTAVATIQLPPIRHREVIVTLSASERQTYDAVLALARSALDDMRAQTSNFACVLSMFTRLRQVAVAAHVMTLGDGTSTRDEIMRVLRRADESLATTGSVVPREDPGARATSMTPGATIAMDATPPSRAPARTPAAPTMSTTARSDHQPPPPSWSADADRAVSGAGHTVTTTKTVVRGQQRTTVTTTVTSAPASGTRVAPSPRTDTAAGDPDTLRVFMQRQRRRLPDSMGAPAMQPEPPATHATIEIVDDHETDADRAADDARESGMGLAMWCLDRRSRAGIGSAKMRAITRILGQVPHDEKALVFSSFAACLDLVADAMAARLPAVGVVQIDGDTPRRDRDERLRAFRAAGGPRVLLMTYKVGAEGLNLAEANHCVCVEPWWTKAVHEQAYSRCWRVGQRRPVTVYNIIAAGTMEQRVVQVARDKSATAAAYMASSASSRDAAAAASRRAGGETALDLATLSRIIG